MKNNYLFTSERLGFREWTLDDLDDFAAMNADPEVMAHFPKPLTREESEEFINRLQKHYKTYGHCYYAAEIKDTGERIGFIGLAYQTFNSQFTPATDIGWRLKRSAWGKGYATEGAQRCLELAFQDLHLKQIFATCTIQNNRSEQVMKKIGMTRLAEFKHPKLAAYPEHENCVCYRITNSEWHLQNNF
ncbi:GNAT family N-acetyltransferase [Gaetbulibacter aestuarii]|uniref:GNAT family N-acetyltransferase n=1 Tax=Gaetbulibacter aestuarii TaxID=1502358 RepID=A0ABW7MYV9_9FLAO